MNYGDYQVTVSYPDRPRKPVAGVCKTAKEARDFAEAMEKWEQDMVSYRAAADVYRKAQADVDARFREDVLREYGLEGHPKAGMVFSMAWEHGHSSGYHEVEQWVRELAELVVGKSVSVADLRNAMEESAKEHHFILPNVPYEVYAGALVKVGV